MLRQERGFTMIELFVVLCVILVSLVIFGNFYRGTIDQHRFSNVVRTFNNSVNVARTRAVQTQQATRLVVRPVPAAPVPIWKAGTNYNLNDIVSTGGDSFRCTQAHAAAATNQPYGNDPNNNWRDFWQFTIDFQYDDVLWIVQHCQGNPLVCANASPYNAADPARIEFNTRGFTLGYLDHTFRIEGSAPATKAGQPGVLYSINPLGVISVQ